MAGLARSELADFPALTKKRELTTSLIVSVLSF